MDNNVPKEVLRDPTLCTLSPFPTKSLSTLSICPTKKGRPKGYEMTLDSKIAIRESKRSRNPEYMSLTIDQAIESLVSDYAISGDFEASVEKLKITLRSKLSLPPSTSLKKIHAFEKKFHCKMETINRKMSKPERLFQRKLDALYPLDWIYTGNVKIKLGTRTPDFINVNGQNAVIEILGDYVHKGEDPKELIAYYATWGYECYAILASEVPHWKDFGVSDSRNIPEALTYGE